MPAYRGDCFVPYSVEIEGDGAGFVTEIGRVMLDAIQHKTNDGYTVGSGVGMPTGFVSALAGTSSTVDSAGTDVLVSSDVYNLQSQLPARFQDNSQWAANLSIWNVLRQFETTAGALKFPSLQNTPPTLLGRPANVVSNMDPQVNAALENYVLVLGDWSQFLITDRVGTRVEIVNHLVGANRRPTGQRGFYAWFRTGPNVLVPNAFRSLDVSLQTPWGTGFLGLPQRAIPPRSRRATSET